jgi:hypothetical protein
MNPRFLSCVAFLSDNPPHVTLDACHPHSTSRTTPLFFLVHAPRSGDAQQLQHQLEEDSERTYYCFALKNLVERPSWHHLLGGAVSQVAPAATAYPWRSALSPLCVAAVLPRDVLTDDGVTLRQKYRLDLPWLQLQTPDMSPAALVKAIQAVQSAYLG